MGYFPLKKIERVKLMTSVAIVGRPEEAVAELTKLYDGQVSALVNAWQGAVKGQLPSSKVSRVYPRLSISIDSPPVISDRTRAFGFCHEDGIYRSTITRLDICAGHLGEQLALIKEHHPDVKFDVGLSNIPIPLAFALNETVNLDDGGANKLSTADVKRYFDMPKPESFIREDGTSREDGRPIFPLLWYNGARTDRALLRLRHYTGSDPGHFQKYILFTNYADYMDEFEAFAQKEFKKTPENGGAPFIALVKPGNVVGFNPNVPNAKEHFKNANIGDKAPSRDPQMPAYHLVRKDGSGVSIMNIGVGPSNAKTATDELAVLRPEAWMMIGHCAGLSSMQNVGDYVLPNGFVLEDGLMEKLIGTNIDIPDLSEIHTAIKEAIRSELGVEGREYKQSVRTGVITTTSDRNWEAPVTLRELKELKDKFARNRSIALDMETGTIVAQGFKHHVPYGALLCVSDKPLHGEPKLPGMADGFYRDRVTQQFRIAMQAMQNICDTRDSLHSRKLYSGFGMVPVR